MFKTLYYKKLNSTNDKAKELARKGQSNLVITSEKQEKGRGRFGRKWVSGQGGLYITILLKEKNLDKVKYLTLIASIAVAKTIKKLTKLNALVKWPNDVLVNDKKICGILTETISGAKNYALIGIGANISQNKFNKSIVNKATSLKIITNKNYNIKQIINEVMRQFNKLYNYYNEKNYRKIINIWKEYSHTLGRKVKAKTLSGIHIGKAVNVDDNCNLILKLDNGKIKKIIEGDILLLS